MVWDGRASHFCTFKIGTKGEINVSDSFSTTISGRYCKLKCQSVFFDFCSPNSLIIKSLPDCFSFIRHSPPSNRSLVGSDSVSPSFHWLRRKRWLTLYLTPQTAPDHVGPSTNIPAILCDCQREFVFRNA